ncbi:MAG: hypothetical protein CW338_02350 [Clostridiales bacterium]|nr:hypothetical protein [Clostridiales bacterium]
MLKRTAAFLLGLILLMSFALAEVTLVDLRKGEEESRIPADADTLDIYFPPINGCNGAVIVCGGTVIVIDSCTRDQYPKLRKVIDDLGIKKIDYCINTHPDNDHIHGFFWLVEEYEVGTFITGFAEKDAREPLQNKMYMKCQELNIPWERRENGEVIELGDLTLRFIQRDDPKWEINNCSLGVILNFKGRTAYFTGDIQRDCQRVLFAKDNPDDISAELINWPHHGYANMQAKFLEKVGATMYVITSGRSTAGGAVQQMKDYRIKTYYFTENHPLHFYTDGEVWQVDYTDRKN